MARSTYLTTLLIGILLFVTGFATAMPVKHVWDFNFKAGNNRLDCPAAGQTKYVGPYGGQWGVLCGWDTKMTSYHWGPISGISFEQCILECGKLDKCKVAAYTGTCYLKLDQKGKGFVSKDDTSYRLAVKLN